MSAAAAAVASLVALMWLCDGVLLFRGRMRAASERGGAGRGASHPERSGSTRELIVSMDPVPCTLYPVPSSSAGAGAGSSTSTRAQPGAADAAGGRPASTKPAAAAAGRQSSRGGGGGAGARRGGGGGGEGDAMTPSSLGSLSRHRRRAHSGSSDLTVSFGTPGMLLAWLTLGLPFGLHRWRLRHFGQAAFHCLLAGIAALLASATSGSATLENAFGLCVAIGCVLIGLALVLWVSK